MHDIGNFRLERAGQFFTDTALLLYFRQPALVLLRVIVNAGNALGALFYVIRQFIVGDGHAGKTGVSQRIAAVVVRHFKRI